VATRLFGNQNQTGAGTEKTIQNTQQPAPAFDLFNQAPLTEKTNSNHSETAETTEIRIKNNIENIAHTYHLIDSDEKCNELLTKLLKQKEICFDTETTDLETLNAEIVGLSFSFKEHEAYCIPFPQEQVEAKRILDFFKTVFENESICKIGQNIKYDLGILKQYDIKLKGPLFDTMLAHYLIEPDLQNMAWII
jgi:DNA polymerase-1